jgi:NAD+ diphosphatase
MLFRGEPLELRLAHASLDRLGESRANLSELLALDSLEFLPMVEGKVPVFEGRLQTTSQANGAELLALLGEHDGRTLVLAVFSSLDTLEFEGSWLNLRVAGDELSAAEASIVATALALNNWHKSHRFCPRCGSETFVESAGWMRRCVADGSEHYPRTDPAVIVAVVDDQDRILLGSQATWESNRWSILAGFVEAGESAEAAAKREVLEESGVQIDSLEYLGSQAWPFPGSLMFGFAAKATGGDLNPDGEEIAKLRWFSREELLAEAKNLKLPNRISIARAIIERWFGGELIAEGEK